MSHIPHISYFIHSPVFPNLIWRNMYRDPGQLKSAIAAPGKNNLDIDIGYNGGLITYAQNVEEHNINSATQRTAAQHFRRRRN